ncbi:MAG: hypothetical protein WKF84_25455 [Pyrinomonadaceae bacterium]
MNKLLVIVVAFAISIACGSISAQVQSASQNTQDVAKLAVAPKKSTESGAW